MAAFRPTLAIEGSNARRKGDRIQITVDAQKLINRLRPIKLNKKIQTDDETKCSNIHGHTQTDEIHTADALTQTEEAETINSVAHAATQTDGQNNNNIPTPMDIDAAHSNTTQMVSQSTIQTRPANSNKRKPVESLDNGQKRPKYAIDIVFNENAVLNISGIEVPQNVLLAISLGPNFVTPIRSVDDIQILSDLSRIKTENSFPHISNAAIKRMFEILKKSKAKPHENGKNDIIVGHIDCAVSFMKENPELMVDVSDKGKKSVIMKRQDYLEKVYEKLSDTRTYEEVATSSHAGLLKRNHKLLTKCYEQGFVTKDGVMEATANETQHARMYGLIKTHKEGYPVRVINAKLNSIGNKLTSIITGILNRMNENDPFNISNTKTLIRSLKEIKLAENDRLFTADIVDMFTNTSATEALDIIQKKGIPNVTNMPVDLFTDIFKFVTQHATEFIFNDQTYKMLRGLPMGGGASPVIASLVTTDWLNHCMSTIATDKIKFVGKYVDDLIIIGDKLESEKLFAVLNTHPDLQFKTTEEENSTVTYLDLTIIRNHEHIQTKWYAKPYASHRLINWHSSHDRSQTMQTAKQFVASMFQYSDRIFYEEIEYLAHDVLRRNSFPLNTAKIMVEGIMALKGELPKQNGPQNVRYIGTSAPWDILAKMNKSLETFFDGNLKFVNKVHNHNLKGAIFSHEKGAEDIELINNTVMSIECKTCKFFYITAITIPLKLYSLMKLPINKHPFHGIRYHLEKVKHAGFEQKILYRCSSKAETIRMAELVSIKKKAKLLGVEKSLNEKGVVEFARQFSI